MRATSLLLFFLLLLPVAHSEEWADEASGLVVDLPTSWDRDEGHERGAVKFAGVYDLTPKKLLRLTIEAVPADGFTADAWMSHEKERIAKLFKKVTQPFRPDMDRTVGDRSAVGYEIAGVFARDDGEVQMRLRVYGVVNGNVFFQITEMSTEGAHEESPEALDEMWSAISFREPGVAGGGAGGGLGAAEGESKEVLDKDGNYKLTLLPGWEVSREPPEDPEAVLRVACARKGTEDSDIAVFEVWRWVSTDPSVFNVSTPTEILEDFIARRVKLFEPYYGQGSAGVILPQVNEGISLGGVSKSGAYEFRSVTLEEQEKIREAEELVRRGEKGVVVPDPPPVVVRGRIALVSPHIYVIRAAFRRGLADDETLLAEYNAVLDSFAFLVSEGLPPPLAFAGEMIGDTKGAPEFAKARKQKALHEEKARKVHQLQYDFVVPPGFRYWDKDLGEGPSIVLLASDDKNNWVRIMVSNLSAKRVGEENKQFQDKREVLESWKSNWESKARGSRIPRKPEKVTLGKLRGDGYKLLEGEVEGFPSSFTCLLMDKSSWRFIVEIEGMGQGYEVFEDGIKDFFKSLKWREP